MENNIQLRLVGITYNQIESGVYALVLEDPSTSTRLAIVIGYPEAQSIECRLQNVRTPRPLTHDLLANMMKALDAQLVRVDIHRLPGGPYAGKLTLRNIYGDTVILDARSSDAIALAIRVDAPIFTSRELLEKEGYIPKNSPQEKTSLKVNMKKKPDEFARYDDAALLQLLEKYVEEENYEAAAKVKLEIEKRKKED